MRPLVAGVLVAAVSMVGCSSASPTIKAKNDQTDPNKKHWEGTTGVLKNYRLPEKKQTENNSKDFGFAKRTESNKEDPHR